MPKADADPHGGIEAWKDLEETKFVDQVQINLTFHLKTKCIN